MKSLLLAALCCACLAFPTPILPQRKRRDTEDAPSNDRRHPVKNNPEEESSGDNPGTSPGWFDRISAVNKGSIFTGRFVIQNVDIAFRIGRSAAPCSYNACLWPRSPDGFVYIPYSISSDFGSYDTTVITSALSDIEVSTCIRFTPWSSETDYIAFVASDGCWSSVGRLGGSQIISLQKPDCIWSGIVTHEVLHALGLHHEHVRSDRDRYVQVQWNNIQPNYAPNFYLADIYNRNLSPYDYSSIMHFSNTAFSSNGILPTLVAIPNSSIQLGQQFAMSNLDILKINNLYECKKNSTGLAGSPTTTRTTTRTSTTTASTTRTTTSTTATTTRSTTTTTTKKSRRTRITTTTPSTTTTTKKPRRTRTTTTTPSTTTIRPVITMLNGCGGNLTRSAGVFTSPNFPKNYPNNAYCHWNITTNIQFTVTFTDFDIEGDGRSCLFDKLRIYNGRDFDTMYRLNDLCGQNLPSLITSYGKSMQFVFTSDSSAAGKGFRVVYQAVQT